MKMIALKFGTFSVIAILLFVALYNTMTNKVGGDVITLKAEFQEVSGLRVGDDVRISGVKVGRVTDVQVKDNSRAEVTFTVQDHQKVTDTTRMQLRYQNLLGEKYLAMTPGARGGERLHEGDEIGLNRTSPGFDLTALLNGFEPLFNVLAPEDMNTLAENIISVLQGESGSVESLLKETGELTHFLANRETVFKRVVDNLTPVVENLASQSGEFDTAVTELKKLMTALNEGSGEFFGSLDGIGDNLDSTARLVESLRPSLERDIRSLRALGATFRRGAPIIERAVNTLPMMVGAFIRSQSYGSHLQVYNCSFGLKIGGGTLWVGQPKGPHSEACR